MDNDKTGLSPEPKRQQIQTIQRASARLISAYVSPEMYDKIVEVTTAEHMTIQAFVSEGVNRLLAEKNIPPFPIARGKVGRPRKPQQS